MKWQQFWSQFKRWFKRIIKDEDLYLRFFALFVAVILWLLAGGNIRVASNEKTFTSPVEVRNIPEDFALTEEPEPVKITLRSRSSWLAVAERDLKAFVDVRNAIEGEGTYSLDVNVPTGADLVSVNPRWIQLKMEKILEKDFPIYIAAIGLEPDQAFESQLPYTEVVRVRAARSIIDQIHQVVVYVGLVHGANRIEGNFPVRAVDQKGTVVEGVSFNPEEILVVLQAVTKETPPSHEKLFWEEPEELSEEVPIEELIEEPTETEGIKGIKEVIMI